MKKIQGLPEQVTLLERIERHALEAVIEERDEFYTSYGGYTTFDFEHKINDLRIEHIMPSPISENEKVEFTNYLQNYANYSLTFDQHRGTTITTAAGRINASLVLGSGLVGGITGYLIAGKEYPIAAPLIGTLVTGGIERVFHPLLHLSLRLFARTYDAQYIPEYEEGVRDLRKEFLSTINYHPVNLDFL